MELFICCVHMVCETLRVHANVEAFDSCACLAATFNSATGGRQRAEWWHALEVVPRIRLKPCESKPLTATRKSTGGDWTQPRRHSVHAQIATMIMGEHKQRCEKKEVALFMELSLKTGVKPFSAGPQCEQLNLNRTL